MAGRNGFTGMGFVFMFVLTYGRKSITPVEIARPLAGVFFCGYVMICNRIVHSSGLPYRLHLTAKDREEYEYFSGLLEKRTEFSLCVYAYKTVEHFPEYEVIALGELILWLLGGGKEENTTSYSVKVLREDDDIYNFTFE